jgi:hypothetical protein
VIGANQNTQRGERLTNDLNNRNREIRIKVRLNPAEHAALIKMADAKGTIPAVLIESTSTRTLPNNSRLVRIPRKGIDFRCLPTDK